MTKGNNQQFSFVKNNNNNKEDSNMSKHVNHHFKDSKMHFTNLRDFTYSVDVKKFSRDRGNMTPLHQHTTNIYKKLQQRSN